MIRNAKHHSNCLLTICMSLEKVLSPVLVGYYLVSWGNSYSCQHTWPDPSLDFCWEHLMSRRGTFWCKMRRTVLCWDSSLRLEENDQASSRGVPPILWNSAWKRVCPCVSLVTHLRKLRNIYVYTLGAWHIVTLGTCQINEQLKTTEWRLCHDKNRGSS